MIGGGPPPLGTLEFSLFGTGFGESVCIHFGNGDWMVVDSCRAGARSEPLALAYLRSIGVDTGTAVKLIALSHWDADHIDGAAELYSACASARIAYSSAVTTAEFSHLIHGYAEPLLESDASADRLREFRKILRVRRERMAAGAGPAPIAVAEGLVLYRNGDILVQALAPSPRTIERSVEALATWLEDGEMDVARRPIPQHRNDFTLVLWICVGTRCGLLGGDLEVTSDLDTGWHAAANSASLHVANRARFFKVAHHGSPNGDHPDIWTNLVDTSDPVCALTAFNRGSTKRPAAADVLRLREHTNLVYGTTSPTLRPQPRLRDVDRTMQETTRTRRPILKVAGQVRVRWPDGGTPVVEVGGSARSL